MKSFGYNLSGQLGDKDTKKDEMIIVNKRFPNIRSLHCGGDHTLIVLGRILISLHLQLIKIFLDDGSVYVSGSNVFFIFVNFILFL